MTASPALAADTIVARVDNKIAAEMGDETVILDIETGQYFQLNKTGARIWGLLEAPMSVAALCEKVEAAFDVDADTCRAEVGSFLTKMHGEGLVRV